MEENPCMPVADFLIKGENFSKRQDGCAGQSSQNCLVRVDEDGYFIVWMFQSQLETNTIECSYVKEVTNGVGLKDLKMLYEFGDPEANISSRVLSIYHGYELGNLTLTQFIAQSAKQAEKWVESLNRVIHRPGTRFLSALDITRKQWRRLTLAVNSRGSIPVKRLVKHFGHDKNEKVVLNNLKNCGFLCAKNDEISPNDLTFAAYKKLLKKTLIRDDLEKVFHEITKGKNDYIELSQLVLWLNENQRDPRLNEILAPPFDDKRATAIIEKYEDCSKNIKNRRLSSKGFFEYLASVDNAMIYPDHATLNQDMDQPLSHYFINSSHNTYLTGRQFRGKSSVDIYRHVLLSGCRCIELDCWDGKGESGEPIITHGKAMCTDVTFKNVLLAIRESAFVTSDYPVILSFETHCSKPQQLKMAKYCEEVFGDLLLSSPLDGYPLEPGRPLPSPNALKRKILIKNKRLSPEVEKGQLENMARDKADWNDSEETEEAHPEERPEANHVDAHPELHATKSLDPVFSRLPLTKTDSAPLTGECDQLKPHTLRATRSSDKSKQSSRKGGTVGDDDDVENSYEYVKTSYTNIHPCLSSLVNYCQSVKFQGFKKVEEDESQKYCHHMSSFSENGGLNYLKSNAVEFVNYNRSQLSRIYPRGSRVDSGNYVPQLFWNAGCHLVSLNFQTNDLGMQLNHSKFSLNGRCGYLLQPELLLRGGKNFDLFSESTFDGVIAAQCDVQVISAQFVSDRAVSTFVEVDMYGLPNDTIRKEYRTNVTVGNGLNPKYGGQFSFRKVICPDLALLRFSLYDDSRQLIGQRVIPLGSLQTGYRYIPLWNSGSVPLDSTTLFVKIKLSSYVPDDLMVIACALENPKAHQTNLLKRHEKQLRRLEDDDSMDDVKLNSSPVESEKESSSNHAVADRSKSGKNGVKMGNNIHRSTLVKKEEKKPKEESMEQPTITMETLQSHPVYMKALQVHLKECHKASKKMKSSRHSSEGSSDQVRSGCCFTRLITSGQRNSSRQPLEEGDSSPTRFSISLCPEKKKKALVDSLDAIHLEAITALKKEQDKEMNELMQGQTKKWMESSKRISGDKQIPPAERERRIRELKGQNVKSFMGERQALKKRQGKRLDRLETSQREEKDRVRKLIEAEVG